MPFPDTDSERVIYLKNPLVDVLCQLRFPSILRISSDAPAGFQDAVRLRKDGRRYPNLTTRSDVILPGPIPQLLRGNFPGLGSPVHDFSSSDKKWTISLNQDFIALTCRDYLRWEEYEEELKLVIEALQKNYSPDCFTRLGLRYKNIIRRSFIGKDGASWAELLQPHILGEMGKQEIEEGQLEASFKQLVVNLQGEGGKVLLQHGLTKVDNELCYVIDSDFFTEQRTEIKDAISRLNSFKTKSGRLFKWCITPDLHRAMDPVSVDDDRAKRSECA